MSAFVSLSRAILLGFLRDRTAVFFAVIFPLMFLVLFGAIFDSSSQSRIDMIEVGTVAPFEHRSSFASLLQHLGLGTATTDAYEQVERLTLADDPRIRQWLEGAGASRAPFGGSPATPPPNPPPSRGRASKAGSYR